MEGQVADRNDQQMGSEMNVVVIVEDEDDLRLLERVMLAAEPRISIAGEAVSAREAINLCREAQPSLIILDHNLTGGMTGLDAAGPLKAASPDSKILLFTNQDLQLQAEANPAIDRFLRKAEVRELVKTVQEMLNLPR